MVSKWNKSKERDFFQLQSHLILGDFSNSEWITFYALSDNPGRASVNLSCV